METNMKAYRFIGVTLNSVDKFGAVKCETDWKIDIGTGSVTRFKLAGCPHTGIEQVFAFIVRKLLDLV
jgi:uncharacterized protein YbaA (DUF1428 family)